MCWRPIPISLIRLDRRNDFLLCGGAGARGTASVLARGRELRDTWACSHPSGARHGNRPTGLSCSGMWECSRLEPPAAGQLLQRYACNPPAHLLLGPRSAWLVPHLSLFITFCSPLGATQAIRLCNWHAPLNSPFSTQGQRSFANLA